MRIQSSANIGEVIKASSNALDEDWTRTFGLGGSAGSGGQRARGPERVKQSIARARVFAWSKTRRTTRASSGDRGRPSEQLLSLKRFFLHEVRSGRATDFGADSEPIHEFNIALAEETVKERASERERPPIVHAAPPQPGTAPTSAGIEEGREGGRGHRHATDGDRPRVIGCCIGGGGGGCGALAPSLALSFFLLLLLDGATERAGRRASRRDGEAADSAVRLPLGSLPPSISRRCRGPSA